MNNEHNNFHSNFIINQAYSLLIPNCVIVGEHFFSFNILIHIFLDTHLLISIDVIVCSKKSSCLFLKVESYEYVNHVWCKEVSLWNDSVPSWVILHISHSLGHKLMKMLSFSKQENIRNNCFLVTESIMHRWT